MEERPEDLFERFRRTGDTSALGRVFDETAPRLLQLAVHFVGDLAAAEDLVQATFVTAIERAPTFDGSRQLETWLAGILANHARDLRKTAQREIPPNTLVERIEATPLDHALDAEWSSALARALDKVPEPYRVVLILRLQQGMEPIEIAHTLQRSAGAVRVQLHRGRELLRKLLPSGIIASVQFLSEPGRGLAQVKSSVVAHAAGVKGGVGLTGLVLMSTKVVIGVAGAIAALAALFLLRQREHESVDRTAPIVEASMSSPDLSPGPAAPQSQLASKANEQRIEIAPAAEPRSTERVKLHGLVYDAESNAGISNADVDLFAPQPLRMAEIHRRWHDRLQVMSDGAVYGFGWPQFGSDITDEQRLDGEDLLVYAPAPAGTAPLEHAVTNEKGEFEIAAPLSLGCIVCSAKSYTASIRPLSPAEVNKADSRELSVEIAMNAPKPLEGYVVDENMRRIERVVRLRFVGCVKRTTYVTIGDRKFGTYPHQDQWIVDTKPDGTFKCDLSATIVSAEDLDPELGIVKQGHLREGGASWVDEAWPETGHVEDPLVIVMKPVASIAVRDRATGTPIEDIHLLCKGDHADHPLRIGRFLAPRGRMRLARDFVTRDKWDRADDHESCECTVWADGYLPLTHHFADLTHGPVTEFELERGESCTITGFVHEAEQPVRSAVVSLLPIEYGRWLEQGGTTVAMTNSDSEGKFRISAANGSYRLRIVSGSVDKSLRVDVPAPSPIDIDVSIQSTILVDARDSSGTPLAALRIVLRSPDGRRVKSKTDAAGLARFPQLSPGSYGVEVNDFLQELKDKNRSLPTRPDQVIPVELGAGESRRVDIVIPSSPRFALLVVDGVGSLVGWKACGSAGEWVDIEPTGRIPLDIRGEMSMRFTDPHSHEWASLLPSNAPDAHVIRLHVGGPGYTGVVTSQDNGQPIQGLRVVARPWKDDEDSLVITTAVCDEKGRFTLEGLKDDFYYFRFEEVPNSQARSYMGIRTDRKPGSPPTQLGIDLPKRKSIGAGIGFGFEGFEEVQLSGVVRHGASFPLLHAGASIASQFPRDGYTLMLWSDFSASADGSFQVPVPVAPTYAASVADASTGVNTYVEWNASGAGDREVHDIELP